MNNMDFIFKPIVDFFKGIKKFFVEMVLRLKAESPKFFQKIFTFMISLGTLSAGLAAFDLEGLPELLKTSVKTVVVVCGICAFLAKLAVKNPEDLKK